MPDKKDFIIHIIGLRHPEGGIFSRHVLAHPAEEERTTIAEEEARVYAMTVETLRRELYLDVLIELYKDREFLSKIKTLDDADRTALVDNLARSALMQQYKTMAHIAKDVATDVLGCLMAEPPIEHR